MSYTGDQHADLNPNEPTGLEPVANVDDAIRQVKRYLTGTGILNYVYPIGHIFCNTVNNDPATLLGFGTWLKLEEVVLVAHKAGSAEFGTVAPNQAGSDVGEKAHVLTVDELPAHTHTLTAQRNMGGYTDNGGAPDQRSEAATITTTSTGGDVAHNNIQPSRVVYMWERTA